MSGYIKLWRSIRDSSVWSLPATQRLVAIELLLTANHKPKSWVCDGEVLLIERGSLITSQDKLATSCGVSRQQVRTSLINLQKLQFITKQTTKRYTKISIIKYDSWQSSEDKNNQAANHQTTKQLTTEQPTVFTPQQPEVFTQLKNKEKRIENKKNTVAPAETTPVTKRDTNSSSSTSDHTAFIAYYQERFMAAHSGAKPTWGAKQGAAVKALLKAHKLAECKRRIDVMFDNPPAWPPPPYDIGTLRQHFDKFIGSTTNGAVSHKRPENKYKADEMDLFGISDWTPEEESK